VCANATIRPDPSSAGRHDRRAHVAVDLAQHDRERALAEHRHDAGRARDRDRPHAVDERGVRSAPGQDRHGEKQQRSQVGQTSHACLIPAEARAGRADLCPRGRSPSTLSRRAVRRSHDAPGNAAGRGGAPRTRRRMEASRLCSGLMATMSSADSVRSGHSIPCLCGGGQRAAEIELMAVMSPARGRWTGISRRRRKIRRAVLVRPVQNAPPRSSVREASAVAWTERCPSFR
jgi:hypothetical protein